MNCEEKLFLDLVAGINSHDCRTMDRLLADDVLWIDDHGKTVSGKENCKFRWTEHFVKFPDFGIDLTAAFSNQDRVAAFGIVHATYSGFSGPYAYCWDVAISAIIAGGKVKELHVYGDSRGPERVERIKQLPGIRGLA